MTPHKRPAAGAPVEAAGPPPLPSPPPGPLTWLRHTLTQRQWHPCQCGHPRIAHVWIRWAECHWCGCTGFVRARQR